MCLCVRVSAIYDIPLAVAAVVAVVVAVAADVDAVFFVYLIRQTICRPPQSSRVAMVQADIMLVPMFHKHPSEDSMAWVE